VIFLIEILPLLFFQICHVLSFKEKVIRDTKNLIPKDTNKSSIYQSYTHGDEEDENEGIPNDGSMR